MAKQVFESPDLLRLIYSFGTPEHRKFTQTLNTLLSSQATLFDDYFQENREIYYNIFDCLSEHSIHELETLLLTFKRCFCCTKHNRNKPIFTNGMVVIPEPSVFETHPTDCPCPCRSLSRTFIRQLEERKVS